MKPIALKRKMIAVIPKKIANAGTNHQPIVIHKNSKSPISTCVLDYILYNQIYRRVIGKNININVSVKESPSKFLQSETKCLHTKSSRMSKTIVLPNRYHIKPATKNPTKISIAKSAVFIVVSV
jgi:hypothetical protein